MPTHIYILAAIDGTGSRAEHSRIAGQSTRSLRLSNTREFFLDFRTPENYKRYFAGPNSWIDGAALEVSGIIEQVTIFLTFAIRNAEMRLTAAQRAEGSQIRICLIGHSRGGLAAIQVASRLDRNVYFLGLLDSVNRTGGYCDVPIRNVQHVFHVRRNNMTPFEDPQGFLMGNTGTSSENPIAYRERFFWETHGVIGWDARSVGNGWIRSNARSLGLPV